MGYGSGNVVIENSPLVQCPKLVTNRVLHGDLRSWSKERFPREISIITFKRHERNKRQQNTRRNEYRKRHCQPLPYHVHKDGDNEPRLQKHKGYD